MLKTLFVALLTLSTIGQAGITITGSGITFPSTTTQTTALPSPTNANSGKYLKSENSVVFWSDVAGGGAPMGMIAMWSGTISNIPTGWVICDGNNGTPNLTDKFIKASTTAGSTGGSNTHSHGHTLQGGAHTLTVEEMPNHNHYMWLNRGGGSYGGSGHSYLSQDYTTSPSDFNTGTAGGGGSHTHPVSGSINSGSNQPEYYSLLFIMKVAPNATPEEPLGTAIVSGTEPTTASLGALWYDTVPNQLKAKINTGWEVIGEKPNFANLGGTTISTSDPASNDTGKTTGHLWINKSSGVFYVLVDDEPNKYHWISTMGQLSNITPYLIANGGEESCTTSENFYNQTTLTSGIFAVACDSNYAKYKVHTFNASGIFDVYSVGNGVVDFLVIAGGGSAGASQGGGGAGGYRTSVGNLSGGGCPAESPALVTEQTYSIVVGNGGAEIPRYGSGRGERGGNSEAVGITSIGGGGGGSGYNTQPTSGGSGGGSAGSYEDESAEQGASGTVCQGFDGGSIPAGQIGAGSGGGAGGNGGSGGLSPGVGIFSDIDGVSICRAGGGSSRGGADPSCGGGFSIYGSTAYSSSHGIDNTGGGGGATGYGGYYGGSGGSGLVIIRYQLREPVDSGFL